MTESTTLNRAKVPRREDLRRSPRTPYLEGINVTVMQDGRIIASQFVMTNDISDQGLGFSYRRHVQPGTRIEVKLCRRDGRQDIIGGQVTHCTRHDVGLNMVGVRLDHAIDPALYTDAAA